MATIDKFVYELTQSVSSSFVEDDTVEFTFQAAGTANLSRNTEQSVDLFYSLASGSPTWVRATNYPKSFGVGTSYATKSFSTAVTGDWQAVKAVITGSVFTASDDSGGTIQPELNIDYDSLQIATYTPKAELTDRGLLVFRSPNRFIKVDSEGVTLSGGTFEAERLVAQELEVFGDVTIFGDFQASPIPPYAGNMISVASGSGNNGTSADYARGDHTHELPFSVIDSVVTGNSFSTPLQSTNGLLIDGDTKLGNDVSDIHTITGSIRISGSHNSTIFEIQSAGTPTINFGHGNLKKINRIDIQDAGSGEGLNWDNANARIDVAPIYSASASPQIPGNLNKPGALRLINKKNSTWGGGIALIDEEQLGLVVTGSNVGIGTQTPSKTLEVIGDVSASGKVYGKDFDFELNSGDGRRFVADSSAGVKLQDPDGGWAMTYGFLGNTGTDLGGFGGYGGSGLTNFYIGRHYTKPVMTIQSGSTTAVGIGRYSNTTPPSTLTVQGDISASSNILTDGKVGIKTTNLSQALNVQGNILMSPSGSEVDSFIHANNDFAVSSDANVLIVADSNDTAGVAASHIIFGVGSAYDTNTNKDFTFPQAYPSGVPRTEVMRINGTTGYVGIGTTSPSKQLHINNGGIIIGGSSGLDAGDLAPRFIIDAGASTGHQLMDIRNDNGTQLSVRGDKVGIGTSSPAYSLDVQSGSNSIIRAYGTSIGRLSLQNSTRHYSLSTQGSRILLYDETGGAERVNVNSNGTVSIGTTTPSASLLQVGDNINSSGYTVMVEKLVAGNNGNIGMADENGAVRGKLIVSSSSPHFHIGTSGNEDLSLGDDRNMPAILIDTNTNNVGIGGQRGTRVPVSALEVSGTLFVTSSGVIHAGNGDSSGQAPSGDSWQKVLTLGGTDGNTQGFQNYVEHGGTSQYSLYTNRWGAVYHWFRGSETDGIQKMMKLHGADNLQYLDIYDGKTSTAAVRLAGTGSLPTYFNYGNVGIGTTSPIAPLHVSTTNTDTDNNLADLTNPRAGLFINNLSEVVGSYAALDFRAGTHDARIAVTYESSNVGRMNFIVDNGNSPFAGMTLDSLGKLGIGITTPTEKLQVAGNISASGNLEMDGDATIAGELTLTNGNIRSDNHFDFLTTGGSAQHLNIGKLGMSASYAQANTVVDAVASSNPYNSQAAVFGGNVVVGPHANGRLGVGTGTANPYGLLSVKGTGWGSQGVYIESTGTNGAVLGLENTQRHFEVSSRNNAFNIRDISADDQTRFNIDSDGNVTMCPAPSSSAQGLGLGINGSTTSKLYISSSGNHIRMKRTGYDEFSFRQSSGNGLEIRNETQTDCEVKIERGKVGIGSDRRAPSESLDVQGNIRLSGGKIYFSHDGPANSNNEFIQKGDTNWGTSSKQAGGSFSLHADQARTAVTGSPNAALFCKGVWSQGAIGIGTDVSPNWVGDGTNTPHNVMMEIDGDVIIQKGHYMTYDNNYYNHGYHRVDTSTHRLEHYGYYGQVFGTNQNANNLFVSHSGAYSRIGIGTGTPDATLKIVDASTSGVNSLNLNDRTKIRGDSVITWGAAADYGILSWDTGVAKVGAQSGKRLDLHANGSPIMTVTSSAATKVSITGGGDGQAFGGKNVTVTENWGTLLAIELDDHESAYLKITLNGNWTNHSGIMFMGEYFLSNGGAGGYNEPGQIIRQIDNTGGPSSGATTSPVDSIRTRLSSSIEDGKDFVNVQALIYDADGGANDEEPTANLNFHIMGEFKSIA